MLTYRPNKPWDRNLLQNTRCFADGLPRSESYCVDWRE